MAETHWDVDIASETSGGQFGNMTYSTEQKGVAQTRTNVMSLGMTGHSKWGQKRKEGLPGQVMTG